jgi:hypothetical protein
MDCIKRVEASKVHKTRNNYAFVLVVSTGRRSSYKLSITSSISNRNDAHSLQILIAQCTVYNAQRSHTLTRDGVGRSNGHSNADAGRDFRSTSHPTFAQTVRAHTE